jgi:cytochrome c5
MIDFMRQNALPVTILFSLLLGCAVQKETGVQYDFPPAMSEAVKASYTRQCEKGRVLYEHNCARCHNKVVKGRQVVPYFAMDN